MNTLRKNIEKHIFRFDEDVIVMINNKHYKVVEILNKKVTTKEIWYKGSTPESIKTIESKQLSTFNVSEIQKVITARVKNRNILRYLMQEVYVLEPTKEIEDLMDLVEINTKYKDYYWNGERLEVLSNDHLTNIVNLLQTWEANSTMNNVRIEIILSYVTGELSRRKYEDELEFAITNHLCDNANRIYTKGYEKVELLGSTFSFILDGFELKLSQD